LNPVIKFTTLFGLLAVELAVSLRATGSATLVTGLAVVFLAAALYFVWRSFYRMRIDQPMPTAADFKVAA
jgi:K(+)-stimulated pyrophosphate-energized sodium pump